MLCLAPNRRPCQRQLAMLQQRCHGARAGLRQPGDANLAYRFEKLKGLAFYQLHMRTDAGEGLRHLGNGELGLAA